MKNNHNVIIGPAGNANQDRSHKFNNQNRNSDHDVCRDPHAGIHPMSSVQGPVSCSHSSRFRLQRGLRLWQLTFNGQDAIIKHEQGMYYVAYLMLNPPAEPIHGLALYLKTNAMFGRKQGAAEIVDPETGRAVPVDMDAVVQERTLGMDDADATGALRRKLVELEAIIDDPDTTEPVREEALRDSKAIYDFQKRHPWRTRRTAQRTSDTVGKALNRFYKHLRDACGARGEANVVLQEFAEHIRQHLLIPSGRAGAHGGYREAGFGGCFTYVPPAGVHWE